MFKINPQLCWRFCGTSLAPVLSNKYKSCSKVLAHYSTKKIQEETIDNTPIKFSTSKARLHKAEDSRRGYTDDRLPYEPEVLMVCLSVFLIYFCILREENDIDKELDRSLYSRIDGLEEMQLKLSLEYNKEKGLDTTAIENRLEEINRQKIKHESENQQSS